MRHTIEKRAGHLKAEMTDRETAAETREFVVAIMAALRESGVYRLLISIRSSRPVFKVEQWDLSGFLAQAAAMPGLRIGFISDSPEVAMSQQYIALLGTQRGLALRTFGAEGEAVAWLTAA